MSFAATLLGFLSPETRAQLERLRLVVAPAEYAKLRADVRAFVASDPITGYGLAQGVVADALRRHGVNVTALALELLVRFLASPE